MLSPYGIIPSMSMFLARGDGIAVRRGCARSWRRIVPHHAIACRVLILEGLIWFVAYLLTGMQVVPRLYFVVKFRRNGVRFTSRMYGERYFLIGGLSTVVYGIISGQMEGDECLP